MLYDMLWELSVGDDELKASRLHEVGNMPYKNKIGEVMITKINQISKEGSESIRVAHLVT